MVLIKNIFPAFIVTIIIYFIWNKLIIPMYYKLHNNRENKKMMNDIRKIDKKLNNQAGPESRPKAKN